MSPQQIVSLLRAAREHGIATLAELQLLLALHTQGDSTIATLAQHLQLPFSSLLTTAHSLQEKNLLTLRGPFGIPAAYLSPATKQTLITILNPAAPAPLRAKHYRQLSAS